MAVQAVVVEELGSLYVILLGVGPLHAHHRGANWTLQKALALVVLTLSLCNLKHIVAILAVEILYLLLKAVPATRLTALDTDIHLFKNELSLAPAHVVHIG